MSNNQVIFSVQLNEPSYQTGLVLRSNDLFAQDFVLLHGWLVATVAAAI